ncbi:MAG TPA: hypothetical protein VFI17_00930 [Solirubrobacterales bacterium]|nr:hypothetical protein [Solirubrobacterales bacterium]
MEPATASLLAKLAPSAIRVIGDQIAGRLSSDEEKRLRKALVEVLIEAASTPPPKLWHPFDYLSWRGDKKRVEKALGAVADPDATLIAARRQEEKTPVEAAQWSWREALAAEFAAAAREGLTGDDQGSWSAVTGGIPPKEWGERMQRGLEWKMATDRGLRHVLQRLDWGTEQNWREASAYATSTYLKAIPIALGLGLAIFLALVGVAVVLAVH